MPAITNRFLLLYASQTGQAQAIAEEIAEKAEKHHLYADLHCIGQTEKKFFIEREKCVVIVASTTGDGDPPDTAVKFFRRINKKTLSEDYLVGLKFTVLGLGDSNYSNFCNHSKNLNRRFLSLGAEHFYTPGWADDAVGLEVVVDPWIDDLWTALKKCLNLPAADDLISDCEHISPAGDAPLSAEKLNHSSLSGDTLSTVEKENQSIDSLDRVVNETEKVCNSDNIPVDTNCTNSIHTSLKDSVDNIAPIYNKNTASSEQINTVFSKQDPTESNKDKESISLIASQIANTCCQEETNIYKSSISGMAEPVIKNVDAKKIESDFSTGGKIDVPSIRSSVPPLSESSLTVPLLPAAFLKIDFQIETRDEVQQHTGSKITEPPVTMASVSGARILTAGTAVKKTIAVELDISGSDFQYLPGDSFHLVCPNHKDEVLLLLNRLGYADRATVQYNLSVIEGTSKKNAHVPDHVTSTGTLLDLFIRSIDIREPPKKALLRVLVEYTESEGEKRRLQELCSKQGASEYTQYVREPSLSILDILDWFPSCHPPVERLIEHLSRLKPRHYSICSSPLKTPNKFEFVFNIVEIPADCGRTYHRKGVCTGWLESLVSDSLMQASGQVDSQMEEPELKVNEADDLSEQVKTLTLGEEIKLQIQAQLNQNFHLPDDFSIPLILIGPGTGVAPFLGYLDHRASQRKQHPTETFGDIWLFYGCRHKDRDYLYKKELSGHVQTGVLSRLLVCFSRDDQSEGAPRYVQDNIQAYGKEIVDLVDNKNAQIYVCGDAKNMAKDVNQIFIDVWVKHKGVTADEAKKVMMKLRLDRRYREDVWI